MKLVTITAPAPHSLADVMKGYVALTKPRIIELLLVTTVPTMVVAANGIPGLWLIVATLIGGTLASGRRSRSYLSPSCRS